MKHSPTVHFRAISKHFLEKAYFMRPEDMARIALANIYLIYANA
jgi:hypothetical protein